MTEAHKIDRPLAVGSHEGLGASTATTGAAMPRGTSAEILFAMQAAMREHGHEPIGQWMRERGYDPEHWLLWLPASYKEQGPDFWPRYVMFSSLIEKPLFMRRGAVFGA